MNRLTSSKLTWTADAPPEARSARKDIIRVQPNGLRGLIILSDGYWGTRIHFWRRRSIPCFTENCPACADRNDTRAYYWVPVMLSKDLSTAMFEITDGAIDTLTKWKQDHHTLRGAEIAACRKNNAPNGRLHIMLTHTKIPLAALPPSFDVRPELEHMWEANTRTLSPAKAYDETQDHQHLERPAGVSPARNGRAHSRST